MRPRKFFFLSHLFHTSTIVVPLPSTFSYAISLFDTQFLHLSISPIVTNFNVATNFYLKLIRVAMVLTAFLNVIPVSHISSMLTSIVLPLFGLLSIYHTFHILIQYIQNPFLLFISIALTIFLQVVFIDQILPYNSQFNTKYLLFRYIYPLWQSYCTKQTQYHIMLPTPFTVTTDKRQYRSLIQDVTPFLQNIIFQ